jgi:hypothetical protein
MSFSLDDIRAAADKKYGSYDVDLSDGTVVKLRNVLRLSKVERKELAKLESELKVKPKDADENGDVETEVDEEVDQQEILEKQLVIVAHNKAAGKALIKEINGDFGLLLHIYTEWGSSTELGEATASES